MDPPDSASPSLQALEQRRARILASINAIGALRPGSVSEIYTKCGRPNCHCQQPGDRGHGPYFRLVYNVDGKQRTRALSARQADSVRAEVAECQRLRRLTGELMEVSEQLCEARLHSAAASSSPPPSKKKPARRSSSPPSKPSLPAS